MCVLNFSVVSDSLSPWIVICQAPLFMGFSRQEFWSGLPLWDLLDLRIEAGSHPLQADYLPSEPLGKPIFTYIYIYIATNGTFLMPLLAVSVKLKVLVA